MNSISKNEELGNVHIHVDVNDILFKHEIIGKIAADYLPKGGKVLDLGCGLGQTLEVLKSHDASARIFIGDAYQVCLDKTDKRVSAEECYLIGEESFDLSAIPDDSFDVVVLSHVLEHLLNPVTAVKELMTKVKKGGVAVLVVPNPVRPEVIVLAALRRHYVNRGHVCAWDRSHWMNFIERILKLDVVEFRSDFIRFPFHTVGPLKPFSIWLAKVMPHWSNGNIAIVRKP